MPEQFTFEEATEPETFSFEDVQEKPEVSGPPPESTPFPGPYGVPMGAWEQPLVKIPPKVTETGLRALMYGPPNLSQLLWLAPKEKREQIIKGVSESLAGQASSLSSPGGLGMVAGAAVAPEIFIPAMVGYGETQLPGAIEEVSKAETTEQKAKAWMDLAGTAGMVLGPVMPGAKAKPKAKPAEAPKAPTVEPPEVQETIQQATAVLPEAAKEAEKPAAPAAQPKEPDASQVEKAAEVHGDVRPLAGEGEGKVPVEKGGEGVQPRPEGGIQAPQAEVVLKPSRGTIDFETFDEPTGEWQKQSRSIVVSKSTIPGDKPWRATVFAGPPEDPVAIAHIQLDKPSDVHGKQALIDLSEQLGRYTRKIQISVEGRKGGGPPSVVKATAPSPAPLGVETPEALNPAQMAEAVGGVKFDAEIDYKLPGKPPMWQFTLTTKGRESTIYVPKGTTVEELRAKVAAKNAEYDAAEGKLPPVTPGEANPNEPWNIFDSSILPASTPEGFTTRRILVPIDKLRSSQRFEKGQSIVESSVSRISKEIDNGTKLPPLTARLETIAGQPLFSIRDGHHRIETLKRKGYKGLVPVDIWIEEGKPVPPEVLAEYPDLKAAPPSAEPRGAEKPAASSSLAASTETPVAGGERASSAAARQGEVGTGSATSQAPVGWSVFQNGEPYGHFKNERQARMAESGLSGNVEVRPVSAADIAEVKRLQEQEKFQTAPEVKAVPAPDVRDVVSMAAQLAKRKDIPAVKKTRLGPLIETARQGNPQPLQAEVERLQRAYPRTVEPKAIRRLFDRETEAVGTDILDWISDNMRFMSKSQAKKAMGERFSKNADLWDEAPRLPVHHNERIYGGTSKPDQVAAAAYNEGRLREPTASALWEAIKTASERRRGQIKTQARELEALETAADFEETAKSPAEDKLNVPVQDLKIGDAMIIEDQALEVTRINPDGTVVLKDGSRWGIQHVRPDETLWVEQFTEAKQPEPAPKPTVPKLGAMEKGTGDLLKGQQEDFALVGERAPDVERIAREKAEAEKRAAEAKAIQDKQQMGLPIPEGPGALTKGTPPTGKSQIEELTDAFRNKAPVRERLAAFFRDSFDYGNRTAAAKDAISRTLAGMKRVGDKLVELTTSFEKPDDLLKAKGVLSADIETRGWRVREFAKAVRQDMPDKRRRAAVSKWIEAGGDTAELQRGERETKPQFKQAYRDAQSLTPDEQIKAQNISNYFDARLQEAIDAGVLENGLEDYIHRIYERAPVLRQRALAYVQSGLLSKNPNLAKKRMFEFDWEAEKAGFVPVQDFLSRVADYETSLSKAIAARAFIGKMAQLTAPDGRPVIGIKGVGVPVEDQAGVRTGTIIKPLGDFKKNANPADAVNYRGDYVNREYNALSRWKWIGTDTDGKPIFLQGDVAIHPDFVGRVDALLKPSQIRYGTNPKLAAAGRAALGISSTFKQTMLDLSGFHQVQIAVHGLEHRVWAMPGKAPPGFAKIAHEIDFADPNVQGLLKGGVTLGGEYHASHYGEGLFGKSISQHIPVLGPVLESYHSWLFQDFIPRVKMTMALHALERNRGRFKKDLASGKMTEDDLMFHTAKQANAAFGELNYIMAERSKTVQDMARIIMLAPDFLEARAKFAAQGLTKYGTEQRVALLLGATTLWALARVANYAINGQPHNEPENLFSVVYKNNAYSLRTVQGDILHAATKPIQFWLNRLNPVYTRSLLELISKRDQFGRKRDFWQAIGDTVSNIVPISLRSSRERHLWESILNSLGLTARRFSDVQTAQQLAQTWKTKNNVRQAPGEFIYDADKDPYRGLKIALSEQDDAGAVKEIKRALDSKAVTVPQMNNYFERYARAPFTGSQMNERKWLSSLSEDERKTVESARQHRLNMLRLYHSARAKYFSARQNP